MFRQPAQTARAIHDMHEATDDLRRVRGLATAVRAASKVVEASATAQTIKAQPMSMETLRTSTRKRPRKPIKRSSWSNVHEEDHRCLPF